MMQGILKLSELLQQYSLNEYEIGSSTWVDITHINNPHSFYARPIAFRSYMPDMNQFGEHFEESDLKVGGMVVYLSETQKHRIRGKVLAKELTDRDKGEKKCVCDIIAVDYGNIDISVTLDNIWKSKCSDVVPLATHCQLADCQPRVGTVWRHEAIDTMKCYVGNERAKLIVRGKQGGKLDVELINTCPNDIATMLILTDQATFGYEANIVNRHVRSLPRESYYTFASLQVGESLHVRVQSGDSLRQFYVAPINLYKKYMEERENFNYYSRSRKQLNVNEMRVNEAVSVLMQHGKYERGIIKQMTVPETKALVQLVDWGNIIETDVTKLKAMTDFYTMKPAIAIYCWAEESQAWDNGLPRFLYPGYEFMITIKHLGDGFDLPNIVDLSPVRTFHQERSPKPAST